jgi:hypothetical protein
MPYAIYRLSGHNPASFGLEGLADHLDYRSIIDSRFTTFGKDPLAVQQDLFNFIVKEHRDAEERRVPDDLELMYTHEVQPYPGTAFDPMGGAGVHDIQMEHCHQQLFRAFDSLKLEVVKFHSPETEHLIDEAREIVNDRNVTLALARVSNPHGIVMNLGRIIADIDRDSRRCVSITGASMFEDCIEVLKTSVEAYTTLHQSMRFVTLATEQKEA